MFGYPLYEQTAFQSLHVIGTWSWFYGLMLFGEHTFNGKLNKKVYDLAVGSSMYAYCSHYFWIVVATHIYITLKLNCWWNILLILSTAELFIFVSYIILDYLISIICCKSKRNRSNQDARNETLVRLNYSLPGSSAA